jgi:hypothetical protein
MLKHYLNMATYVGDVDDKNDYVRHEPAPLKIEACDQHVRIVLGEDDGDSSAPDLHIERRLAGKWRVAIHPGGNWNDPVLFIDITDQGEVTTLKVE